MIKVWNFTYKENYDIQAEKDQIVYMGLKKKKITPSNSSFKILNSQSQCETSRILTTKVLSNNFIFNQAPIHLWRQQNEVLR